jgi:hypothetical protein
LGRLVGHTDADGLQNLGEIALSDGEAIHLWLEECSDIVARLLVSLATTAS